MWCRGAVLSGGARACETGAVLRVGLTGGIGAGKSTVSGTLAQLGAVVVDADTIAREVVEPGTEGLAKVVEAFGQGILLPDGSLDRPKLAAVAFATDQARATLNGIVHPLVGRRTAELVHAAGPDAVVVNDIPLLVENGLAPAFHLVVVVHADVETRVRRLTGGRGMAEADARARIAAQATDAQRRAAADVWLDNAGSPEQLAAAVREVWGRRIAPYARNLRTGAPAEGAARLVAHNPDWAAQAARLVARLRMVCGAGAVRVDHVGSTAVAGLPAKDVLDLQVTVADLAAADALAGPLAAAGFPARPDVTADNPKPEYGVGGEADPGMWAKRYHQGADPARPANVHLRVDGWPGQRFALLFPAWLAADDQARAEYAQVKQAAQEAAGGDGARYAQAKEPWFDSAYHRAWQWAHRTGWAPTSR